MKRSPVLAAAMCLISTFVIGTPSATSAAPTCGANEGLTSTVTAKNLGDFVPVVLVHGWTASAAQFTGIQTGAALYDKIVGIGDVKPVLFDYGTHSTEWVDSPYIGGKLAQAVTCLADLSKAGNGRGKVVVVGYSMGGLAARFAVAHSGAAGLVVTIATPHNGALPGYAIPAIVADKVLNGNGGLAMTTGRVAELPTLEKSGVEAFYVGGRLGAGGSFSLFGRDIEVGADALSSDLIVALTSAIPTLPLPKTGTSYICQNDPRCNHVHILEVPGVQDAVVKAIKDWIAAHPLPTSTPQTPTPAPQPTPTPQEPAPPPQTPTPAPQPTPTPIPTPTPPAPGPAPTPAPAPSAGPPAAPSNLIITAKCPGTFHIFWTDNSDNEDGFVVTATWLEANTTETKYLPANTTGIDDVFDRLAGSHHRYTVAAFNAAGTSSAVEGTVSYVC